MTGTALSVPLRSIESCFQGAVPGAICSVAKDGTPNVTLLSIVHIIDDDHVALSRQFFNKTVANMQENPYVQVGVLEPDLGHTYVLDLEYERTELEGELFDRMKTRLDAVASQFGMSKVFRLAAVEICRVLACEAAPGDFEVKPPPRPVVDLALVDRISRKVSGAFDTEDLINVLLESLESELGFDHSILMLPDETGERLFTVASRGYDQSGVGSEIWLGQGIIGVSAMRQRTINIANLIGDQSYTNAIRMSVERFGGAADLSSEIALPGLERVVSQISVPILARDRLMGLLVLESETANRFSPSDEALLNLIAREVGMSMALLKASQPEQTFVAERAHDASGAQAPAVVKHYAEDDSIFVDNEYVIKGVAGRILWRLLQNYSEERRVDFTNKEIRLDPGLDLPDIKDNLESRLILLRRRLGERCDFVQIESAGRGRLRLHVNREFTLREVRE